jgi:hypothetical protein
MNTRRRLVALGVSAAALAFSFLACGSYDEKTPATTAGMTASTATMEAASSAAATTGDVGTPTSTATTETATTGGTDTVSTSGGAGGMTSASTDGGASTTGSLEASCDNVAACGGDVVGTWSVGGSCLTVSDMADISGFGLGCMLVPVEGTLQVTGTLIFNADGTFTDTTVTSGDITFSLPPECLMISGTSTTCDRIGGPAQQSLGFATLTCTDNTETGGCDCPGTIDQAGSMAFVVRNGPTEGMYTSADNVLTMGTTEYTYCVEENILTMSLQSTPKPGPVTGTVALQKQ